MADASSYSFACPHCGAVNPVAGAQLGAVVACAACARPFRSDIPAGKPVPAGGPAADRAPAAVRSPSHGVVLRLHPAVWRMRFAATCFDLVLIVGGLAFAGYATMVWRQGGWAYFFLAGGAALALVGGFNLLLPWFNARGEVLEVTAVSTRWARGVFKRRSVEIRHDAVRAVEVEQTLAQRLLGIGTLTLASDGNDGDEIVMKGVPGVRAVAAKIQELQGR